MLALVTAAAAADHDSDLEPLRAAFVDAGVSVEIVCWDDATVDWGRFDAAFLRSTWDYAERVDEFVRWLDDVTSLTQLVNAADVIAWNIDKHYLTELEAAGVAVVPTTFIEIGAAVPELDGRLASAAEVYVVKPTIGAGSQGARRCLATEVADHVTTLHRAGKAAMVQPYLDMIDEHAETSLVYLGRGGPDLEYDHAFRKGAILQSTDVEQVGGLMAAEEIGPREATTEERALAEQVLAAAPLAALSSLAYARVDVVPTPSGPVLLELELVEPSLYFESSAGSAGRAAAAWRCYLDRIRS